MCKKKAKFMTILFISFKDDVISLLKQNPSTMRETLKVLRSYKTWKQSFSLNISNFNTFFAQNS